MTRESRASQFTGIESISTENKRETEMTTKKEQREGEGEKDLEPWRWVYIDTCGRGGGASEGRYHSCGLFKNVGLTTTYSKRGDPVCRQKGKNLLTRSAGHPSG